MQAECTDICLFDVLMSRPFKNTLNVNLAVTLTLMMAATKHNFPLRFVLLSCGPDRAAGG